MYKSQIGSLISMKEFCSAFILALLLFSASASAQESVTRMHSLYIYNFIKNIKWKNIDDRYIIGVFAKDATVEQIATVLGTREFNGKSIEVKKLTSPSQVSNCHIVFVSSAFGSNVKKISESNVLKNTLLVSEKGELNNGASIAFILENSKLKFKINEDAFKTSNLQISATLLSLGV